VDIRHSMSRAAALGFVVGASLAFVGAVQADAPFRDVEHVDQTFLSNFWTAECGFDVLRTQIGTARFTLHTQPGSAHEIDTFSDWTETLSAPSTGRSFKQIVGPVRTGYPEGIFVGAPARIIFLGNGSSVPGLTEAGRYVYEAEVVFVLGGVPVTDVFAPISTAGHDPLDDDFDAYVEAGCAALGP